MAKAPRSKKARRMLNADVDLAEAARTGEPFEFEGKTYVAREAPSYEPELPPLQYKKEHEPECPECHSSLYRERVVSWLPWPARKTDCCINPDCPNAHPKS